MNEPFAPFRRRIDPSVEPSFRLGALYVSPATLEVKGPQSTEALEPRIMQVLVALHRQMDEAVTRDDLSQLCWGGVVVGDDALNRSISRLRRVLAADPLVAVDTIPKIGYRLRVEAPTAPGVASVSAAGPGKRRFLYATALAAIAAIASVLVWGVDDGAWSADGVRPLTRDAGVETHPALSPDGAWLAYAAGEGFGRSRDIHLRGLGVGDTASLALSDAPADEMSPAWSPDGRRLAFVRQVEGEPCAVIVTSPPRGVERVVARCRVDSTTSLTWLGDDEIVFADRDRPDAPRRLFVARVSSGAARPLTDPPAHNNGDVAPVASPDGKLVAFRRTAALGSDDVMVVDAATGAERALTADGWKALGLAWSADSGTVFVSSNRQGDFGLWALDAAGRDAPRRVSLGLLPFGQMSTDRQGRLAAQVSRIRANLFALSPGGRAETVTTAAGIDWDPDAAPDGSLVYASDLSGTAEIWIKRSGGAPVRLTDLKGSYVHSPRWSPNGREIAFVGVVGQKSDIYVIRSDGSRLRRATMSGSAKGSVAWTGRGGELVFSTRTDLGWRAMLIPQPGARPREIPGGAGTVVVRRGPDGTMFVRTARDAALRVLDLPAGRLTPLTPRMVVENREAWVPARTGVYDLRGAGTTDAALWFTQWSGESRRVAAVDTPARPNFTVRPGDGAVVVPMLRQDDSDIVLLELSRR